MLTLKEWKNIFEKALSESVEALETSSQLRKSTSYAFDGGGKRVRPLIVLILAESLKNHQNVIHASLATEYFHTASIIADDMPCMDNDTYRRDRYSLHKVFGESVALLTSYGMIAEGFRQLQRAIEIFKRQDTKDTLEVGLIALECATRCSGYSGAVSGQFYDLFPSNGGFSHVEKVIELKTVTFFEGAFVYGWIFGGGSLSRIEEVRKLAYHFGFAFQIADDLQDYRQDISKDSSLNIAVLLGIREAERIFSFHVEQFLTTIQQLSLQAPLLLSMLQMLESQVYKGERGGNVYFPAEAIEEKRVSL